jgi:hypothetical protein
MALPATEDWVQSTGSDQDITTFDSKWTEIGGGMHVPSGVAQFEPDGGAYNTSRWNADTFNADQYSQTVITSTQISGGIYCGPAARCQSGADTSYHIDTNGGSVYLSKDVAGSPTTLAGPLGGVSFAAGDVCKLTVEGVGATVTVKVWKALAASPTTFVEQYSYDDTAGDRITTAGYAGVFAYGSSTDYGGGAWEGGNIGGGGGGPAAATGFRSLLGVGR